MVFLPFNDTSYYLYHFKNFLLKFTNISYSHSKKCILGNCTGDISTWQLDQKIEVSNDIETVLALNSKISCHNDCVNGVR